MCQKLTGITPSTLGDGLRKGQSFVKSYFYQYIQILRRKGRFILQHQEALIKKLIKIQRFTKLRARFIKKKQVINGLSKAVFAVRNNAENSGGPF